MLHSEIRKIRDAIAESKEMRKDYTRWLNDPMTKNIVEILTVSGLPKLMTAVDKSSAEHVLGYHAGWADCISMMQELLNKPSKEVESTFEEQ